MKISPVDPRTLTSQIDSFSFRVYFWNADATACDEWELTDASVEEAQRWARQHANGRSFELLVCFPEESRGLGYSRDGICGIRIHGVDPTAAKG